MTNVSISASRPSLPGSPSIHLDLSPPLIPALLESKKEKLNQKIIEFVNSCLIVGIEEESKPVTTLSAEDLWSYKHIIRNINISQLSDDNPQKQLILEIYDLSEEIGQLIEEQQPHTPISEHIINAEIRSAEDTFQIYEDPLWGASSISSNVSELAIFPNFTGSFELISTFPTLVRAAYLKKHNALKNQIKNNEERLKEIKDRIGILDNKIKTTPESSLKIERIQLLKEKRKLEKENLFLKDKLELSKHNLNYNRAMLAIGMTDTVLTGVVFISSLAGLAAGPLGWGVASLAVTGLGVASGGEMVLFSGKETRRDYLESSHLDRESSELEASKINPVGTEDTDPELNDLRTSIINLRIDNIKEHQKDKIKANYFKNFWCGSVGLIAIGQAVFGIITILAKGVAAGIVIASAASGIGIGVGIGIVIIFLIGRWIYNRYKKNTELLSKIKKVEQKLKSLETSMAAIYDGLTGTIEENTLESLKTRADAIDRNKLQLEALKAEYEIEHRVSKDKKQEYREVLRSIQSLEEPEKLLPYLEVIPYFPKIKPLDMSKLGDEPPKVARERLRHEMILKLSEWISLETAHIPVGQE